MDTSALHSLSYGMYVVSARDGARDTGCVANSVIQVSSSPATLAISLNKNNFTTSCIGQTGQFTVSVLSEDLQPDVIGTFGFSTSRDKDKFAGVAHDRLKSGLAVLSKDACAYLECRVINQLDCHTHTVFFAEITDAQKLSGGRPMTYEYYHRVIKGKAPKNAPTYIEETPAPAEAAKKPACKICGYVFDGTAEEFDALPDSYVCPVCGAPKSCF